MRKNSTRWQQWLLSSLLLLGSTAAWASGYVPVPLAGYNADIIANGSGAVASTTTADIDGGLATGGTGYTLLAQDYRGPLGQLPNNATYPALPNVGVISSNVSTTPGLLFQFGNYNANNALRLIAGTAGSGTLSFVTPQSGQDVYVLATSGSAAATLTIRVNFQDGTFQDFTSQSVPDWFATTSAATVAKQLLGRVSRGDNTVQYTGTTVGPRLYQLKLSLSAANASKPIASLTFTKTTDGNLMVLAASLGLTSACAGAPAGGQAIADVSTACSTTSIGLAAVGAATGGDITCQWQASTNGGTTWANISGATSTLYTATGQTATTQYRAALTCTGSTQTSYSDPVTVTQAPLTTCNCTALSNGGGEYIRSVSLNTLSNVTNANASGGGYTDYGPTGPTTTLNAGGIYPLTLGVRVNSSGAQGGVWLDTNQNGVFDAAEYTALGTASGSSADVTLSASVLVPASASAGLTRMRVRWRNSSMGSSDACITNTYANTVASSNWYGETEDYLVTVAAPQSCGTIPLLDATASATIVCPNTPITLSADGLPAGQAGFSFQWKSRPRNVTGATYAPLGSAQSTLAYTVSSQTVATDYVLTTTCTANGQSRDSNPVAVEQSPFSDCYCVPSHSTGCATYGSITRVLLNTTLDNSSGCASSPYYTNVAKGVATTATLNPGTTYPLAVTVSGATKGGVWIDFDHNSTFDTSEYFALTSGTSTTLTASLVIPAGALTGDTRMRIRTQFNSTLAAYPMNSGVPCTSLVYGETEDYTITLAAPQTCGTLTTASATSNAPAPCAGTSFTLGVDGITPGTTGLTYQWQASTDGRVTWTNLGTAQASPNYATTGPTVATDYRVVITCPASGQSITSAYVSITRGYLTCYCAALGTGTNEHIRRIVVNTLTNTTNATSTSGYGDFTNSSANPALTTTLNRGASYVMTLEVKANNGGSQGGVWLDYNHDGSFDQSEYTFIGGSSLTGTSGTSVVLMNTLTIPATALTGPTRMRVRWRNNGIAGSTDACSATTASWSGETEDYYVTIASVPACAATPTAGTANTSVTAVCPSTPFTLFLTGYSTDVSGLTYQWQSSAVGANSFSDISGAAGVVYNASGQPTAADYRAVVTCAATGQASPSSIIRVDQLYLSCYCTPTYASGGTTTNILNVSLGTLTNASTGNASPYYRDYTGQQPATIAIPDLTPGTTVNLELTLGTATTQFSAAWIDFNQNGTFDASEFFSLNTAAGTVGSSRVAVIPINVPAGARLGQTRLRIRGGDNVALTSANACGASSSTLGEAEDYLVNVVPVGPCTGQPAVATVTSTANSACVASPFVLSATGLTAGATGFSYQWQSSTNGGTTWNNLGAPQTSPDYTVSSQLMATDYRVIVTCTTSGLSSTSAAFSVAQSSYLTCYCAPLSTGTNEYIRNVAINTLANQTNANSSNGFGDYTNYASNPTWTTTLNQGVAYPLTVEVRSNASGSQAGVWIDYDQNGVFDASEFFAAGGSSATATNVVLTSTLTIPVSARTGLTRLRVRWRNASLQATDACTTPWTGETEDYVITIAGNDLIVTSAMSPYTVPATTYSNVTIQSGASAALSGATVVNGSFVVQNGGLLNTACQPLSGSGTFALAAGAELQICDPSGIAKVGAVGAVQVTGNRDYSTDATYTYTRSGTTAAAQTAGPGLPTQVRSLKLNNTAGLTLTNPVSISQAVTLTGGDLSLNGNMLTLLSGGSGTALVDNTGGRVLGTATMQRYISPSINSGAGYRHYSSPVLATTLSDLSTAGYTPTLNAAYNTSPTPTTVTSFPTLFDYDETRLATTSNNLGDFDKGWRSPTSLSSPMEVGRGYTANIGATQLVDFVGTLNSGAVAIGPLTRGASAAAGWHLLGNPYPSPLDWSLVNIPSSIGSAMYVWKSTGQYTGNYVTYMPGVTSTNPLIAAGQAFFVRAITAGATLNLDNTTRVTSFANSTATFNRSSGTQPLVQLSLNGPAGTITDEAYVHFETGATAGNDGAYDAFKLYNTGPNSTNLYSLAGPEVLSVNGLTPLTTLDVVVPLGVAVPHAGAYTLDVDRLVNFAPGTQVFLRDKDLNTVQALISGSSYAFTMAAATLATATRFELVFKPAVAPLGSRAGLQAAQVSIFPNPAHQQFGLYLGAVPAAKTVQATLYNTLGQAVLTRTLPVTTSGVQAQFDVRNLATGVYVLRLSAGNEQVTKRVVIE